MLKLKPTALVLLSVTALGMAAQSWSQDSKQQRFDFDYTLRPTSQWASGSWIRDYDAHQRLVFDHAQRPILQRVEQNVAQAQQIWQPTKKTDPALAPEIDPAGAMGALTILAAALAIVRGRRSARKRD